MKAQARAQAGSASAQQRENEAIKAQIPLERKAKNPRRDCQNSGES